MVKAVVLYGPPEDPDAFERYYADTHTALAQKIPGLRRCEAARGFATPDGSAVPYQRIAERDSAYDTCGEQAPRQN